MNITINGESRELMEGSTIVEALALLRLPPDARGVAVAVGYDVIPKSEWGTRVLKSGENIEVVTAKQGG